MRPTWPTDSPQTPPGRQRHSACLIGSKRVFIFGGFDGARWLSDLHVLDVGRMEESDLETGSVQTLIGNLKLLLNNPEFADVTFLVGGKKIFAHKAILVAQCEHFRALFSSTFREAKESEISIDGPFGELAFLSLLEWLYTGRVPAEMSTPQMCEVLGLADQYNLTTLMNVMENVLVHDVEIDNCCHLLKISDRHGAQLLKTHCMTFLLKHFEAVAKTVYFEELSAVPSLLLEVTRAAASQPRTMAVGGGESGNT